jgi:hypothetical protein
VEVFRDQPEDSPDLFALAYDIYDRFFWVRLPSIGRMDRGSSARARLQSVEDQEVPSSIVALLTRGGHSTPGLVR